jgi:hypothetical protein
MKQPPQPAMNHFPAIICLNCGENCSLPFDPTDDSIEFVADCEVCCRPMTVSVQIRHGTVTGVQVRPA